MKRADMTRTCWKTTESFHKVGKHIVRLESYTGDPWNLRAELWFFALVPIALYLAGGFACGS